jgi:hypothetical protein
VSLTRSKSLLSACCSELAVGDRALRSLGEGPTKPTLCLFSMFGGLPLTSASSVSLGSGDSCGPYL